MPTARLPRPLAVLLLPLLVPAAPAADGDDPAPPPPLVGTVVDAAGAPVAGAEVGTLSETGPVYTLNTDAAGRFTMPLERYPDGRVNHPEIIARGPDGDLGFLHYSSPSVAGKDWAWGVNADGSLTVALAPPRRVTVAVRFPDGSPAAGVPVYALCAYSPADVVVTDDAGAATFTLPAMARASQIVAVKPGAGYGHVRLGPDHPLDGPTEGGDAVEVSFSPAWTHRIKVVAAGPDGALAPVPGAKVSAWIVQTPADDRGANLGGLAEVSVTAGADGVAAFDWLPRDLVRATCWASADGYEASRFVVKGAAAGGEQTVEVVANGTLAGRVLLPGGVPAAGVAVKAVGVVSGPTMGEDQRANAVTDAAGAYAMTVPGRGLYLLTADPPGAGEDDGGHETAGEFAPPVLGRDGSLAVLPGEVTTAPDLVFSPEVRLTGAVTTHDGEPAAGVTVYLTTARFDFPDWLKHPEAEWVSPPQIRRTTETGPDGRYAFRLAPGDYEVQAAGAVRGNDELTVPADRAAVSRNFTLLPPDRTRTYAGRVTDVGGGPIAGATITAAADTWGGGEARQVNTAVTDADGRYAVEFVGDRVAISAEDPRDPPPGRDRRRGVSDLILSGPTYARYPDEDVRDGIDFTLHEHVVVTGLAAGPAGQSLVGLPLELSGPDMNSSLGGAGPLADDATAGPRGRFVFTNAWGGAENTVHLRDGDTWYRTNRGVAGVEPGGPVSTLPPVDRHSEGFPLRSLDDCREAAFAAPADLPGRVAALAEVAGRMNRRCLLLVADPATDAGRELFDAVYEDLAGAAAADAGFLTQVVPLARAADVPAVAAADLGPAGLAVLEPDGTLVAAERFDGADPAAVVAFLKRHAPAKDAAG